MRRGKMARREVLQVTCDRCGKDDLQDRTQTTDEPELVLQYRGEKVVYEDLCKSCRSAVQGYSDRIMKKEQPKKDAEGKKDPPEEAPKKRSFLGGR
jgi:hypothetical protein